MEYVFPNILPEQGMVVQSWLHIYPISQYITAVKILFLLDSELELELKDVKKDLNSESGSGSSTGIITALVSNEDIVSNEELGRVYERTKLSIKIEGLVTETDVDALFRQCGVTSEHDARAGNGHADWDGN